ncbi:MAG: hypothetical protein HGA44_22630, partial [Cellulomonadaceae bacterium]|nr:hypothetical protein [Cellulomonadaceae bacterium]
MAATSGARRRRVRPGTVPLAVGLVGLASAVTLTAVASYPVPLGVMLGLVLLFMVGIYLTVGGAFELR